MYIFVANKYMEKWPTSFVISEIQVKTALRCRCTSFEQLVFVSCGCCNKLLQTLTLKDRNLFSHSLNARSPRSRGHNAALSRGTRGDSSFASSSFCWLLAFRALGPPLSLLHLRIAFSAVSLPSLIRTLVMAFRAHMDKPG